MGHTLYLSIPFTWLLPEAVKMALGHKQRVIAGGPAVDLMPHIIDGVADIHAESLVPPLMMHNPLATFTTRGCPNRCPFCAVPKIEGDFRELQDWEPKPVICDNNLLASSRKHFDQVINRLKPFPFVDFNQGLDADLFTPWHARRISELHGAKVRFAFDNVNDESSVKGAVMTAQLNGLLDISIYVLVGFHDTLDDARYRLETVRSWGIQPNPMRYQPLDALHKNSYVSPDWKENDLRRVIRYYNRLRWLEHIPFEDYEYCEPKQEALF
jgi:hypothetical protein